jgi:hypothetical protein
LASNDQAKSEEILTPLERWPTVRRWAKYTSAIIAGVGVAAAGIGYLTSGVDFFSQATGYFRDRTRLHTLIVSADERLKHSDYQAAWSLNNQAHQLSPRDTDVATQQAHIAMRWIENVRISSAAGPQTFGAVVDPLKAVLITRVEGRKGRERANIEAHIGWANFLISRDGTLPIDVGEEFEAAIKDDPDNFYGHLLRGFWVMWQREPVENARADFEVAMRSDVDPAFTDRIIMAAITNTTTAENQAAALSYADKIRQTGRDIDSHTKSSLMASYYFSLHDKDLLSKIEDALPPGEQIQLLSWLKQGTGDPGKQRTIDYFIAHFCERDGRKQDAIKIYSELISSSKDKENDTLAMRAQADIRRLAKK